MLTNGALLLCAIRDTINIYRVQLEWMARTNNKRIKAFPIYSLPE